VDIIRTVYYIHGPELMKLITHRKQQITVCTRTVVQNCCKGR